MVIDNVDRYTNTPYNLNVFSELAGRSRLEP